MTAVRMKCWSVDWCVLATQTNTDVLDLLQSDDGMSVGEWLRYGIGHCLRVTSLLARL